MQTSSRSSSAPGPGPGSEGARRGGGTREVQSYVVISTLLTFAVGFYRHILSLPLLVFALCLIGAATALTLAQRSGWSKLLAGGHLLSLILIIATTLIVSMQTTGSVLEAALVSVLAAAYMFARHRKNSILLLGIILLVEAAFLVPVFSPGNFQNDAYWVVQRGAATLLHGGNPYAHGYPVYTFTPGSHLSVVARISSFRYVYGPSILLLSLPGRMLGDARYSLAVAAVVLMWFLDRLARDLPDRSRALFRLLLVTSPFFLLQVLFGWVDVIPAAFLAAWWLLRQRHPRPASILLGIAIAAKPTFFPALFLLALWLPRVRKEGYIACLTAVAICLPFALWTGLSSFLLAITRAADVTNAYSLNLTGLLFFLGRPAASKEIWAASMAVSFAVIAWKRPRHARDIFLGCSALTSCCLLFAPQAFLNYYFYSLLFLLIAWTAGDAPIGEPVALPFQPAAKTSLHAANA